MNETAVTILQWVGIIYAIGWVALSGLAFHDPDYGPERLKVRERFAIGFFWPLLLLPIIKALINWMRRK